MSDALGAEALKRAYEAGLRDAVGDGGRLMKRVTATALAKMPDSAWLIADIGQRNVLSEAIRLLMKHQQFLSENLPQALMDEFAKAVADASADEYREGSLDDAFAAPVRKELSFDRLELISEEQIESDVELLKAQQAIAAELDLQLAELNALMAAAQGLVRVQQERNPLRPEVYIRAIRAVADRTQVGHDIRRHWMRHFADALAPELKGTYSRVSALLKGQGVRPAGYQVINQDSPVRDRPDLARANADLAASLQAMGFQAAAGGDFHGVDPASLLAAAEAAGMVVTGPQGRRVIAPGFFSGPAFQSHMVGAGSAGNIGSLAGGAPFTPVPTISTGAGAGVPAAPGLGGAALAPMPAGLGGQPAPVGGVVRQKLRSVERMRRIMAGDDPGTDFETGAALDEEPDSPLDAPEYAPTVPAAFDALIEMRQVDTVMQRLRERKDEAPPEDATGAAALRHALQRQLDNPGQSLTLEVVAVMVENLANDPRLLLPVQEAVRALEPCLLRLALADSRFFSDPQHPARALLDQIAQRSLAWNSVEGAGFADFIEPVQDTIRKLSEAAPENAKPFETALRHLQDIWSTALKRDQERRQAAVRALLAAEQRNVLAEKIASQFDAREDIRRAPREVARFLLGPWAQVVAQSRISAGNDDADPKGYLAIVSDLLWSADLDQVVHNTARLTRVVPRMVSTLREGLASIDYESAQIDHFIDYMAALHEQALRAHGNRELASVPASSLPPEESVSPEQDPARQTWLAPAEMEAAGFMPPEPQAEPQTTAEAALQALAALPFEESGNDGQLPILGLETGAWVELFADDEWTRWQLTWASPHGTLFMFTDATGGARSMTKRLLVSLVANGRLRMVAARGNADATMEDEFSLGPLI